MNIRPRMEGKGEVKDSSETIEMKNPMEDLVSDGESSVEVNPADVEANEKVVAEEGPNVIDSTEATVEELLPPSDKPGFDESEVQDARIDRNEEGGVTNPLRSTGPMKNTDPAMEGGLIKQDHLGDATENAYELSGFHVEVPTGTGAVSQQITMDFDDLETAKACVNGGTFLMPLQGRVKACKITRGAPIICFNERQILEYIDGRWRKP